MLNRLLNYFNPNASASAAYALQSLTSTSPLPNTTPIWTPATPPSVSPQEIEEEQPKATRREAKLIMVTPDNNNKFYDMRENTDGTFSVTYGRVGARGAEACYPMRDWDTKIREKTRKGYKD